MVNHKKGQKSAEIVNKQGRPELPIGPISVDLDTFDPIITI